jgi:hypothetical protein
MPRGRSTFNKRQKEQARQQKQRDKAERKHSRKNETEKVEVDEMSEMLKHARAQAALFNADSDEINADRPGPGSHENGND